MTAIPVATLLERLSQADELETAQRVAAARGLTVEVLLARHPPNVPEAQGIVDLYEMLRDKGYTYPRIGYLTGRHHSGIVHVVRYRRQEAFRAKRARTAKLAPAREGT